jgi:hypothetical protein
MGLLDIAKALAEYMERNQRDYALVGGFALYAYGYVRATRDIDFVVRLRDQQVLTRFLESLGFETTHQSDVFSNYVHPVGGVRVDLMYVDGTTADMIFGAATRRVVLEGFTIPVASAEHLVAMKLFSAQSNPERRLKDLADAAEIVRRAGVAPQVLRTYCVKYGMERYFDELAGAANGH